MKVATIPNNTNLFPNSLTLHIYKSILLFIIKVLFGRVYLVFEFGRSEIIILCVTQITQKSLLDIRKWLKFPIFYFKNLITVLHSPRFTKLYG